MGNYYDKKSTGGRTTSKIENQDSVAAIYALEQLHSTDIFGFGTKIVDFCIKCEGEEDIEIFNKEKHIFIQLKSSVIGKSDFADILEHYLTLNSDNTSTENFFVLTSFVPIRINEKNFKEYLDDYVKVLVNPYETDEKKNQVKDALISNFALSKYADIIDKVRVEVRPLFKDSKDTKAIFGRYLRLNYIFKDPGDIIVDNLYTNLTNKFAELRRKRGAITRAELEEVVNSAISKGSIFSGLSLSVGYSKIENGYVENEQKVKKRDLIMAGFKKAKKDIMRGWRKAYRKELIISCIFSAKRCPQCGHPMMAKGLYVFVNRYDGIDLPDDACRIIVVDGLPNISNMNDRYEQEIVRKSKRIQREQIQRIEQGMGRGVRSSNDYCLVYLLGNQLTNVLYSDDGYEFFSNATKAQFKLSEKCVNRLRGRP